ncbi:hypothetical protein BJY52DRAFT_1262937 [Lactarius psammicola]|nr:hypothetical protein BJY52DRAFT_1262937 [Lactarius psammicola]
MPKKSTHSPSGSSFFPPNDPGDRLKTNALTLNRRKSRYQFFLAQLIIVIIFLLCEVLLNTSFLSVPYQYFLRRAIPSVYGPDAEVHLPPYVASDFFLSPSPFDPLSYLFFHRPSFSARSSSPTRLGKTLIFSSRVERVFREAYERYRTAFERKRDERERQAAARNLEWMAPAKIAMEPPAGDQHPRRPQKPSRGRPTAPSVGT